MKRISLVTGLALALAGTMAGGAEVIQLVKPGGPGPLPPPAAVAPGDARPPAAPVPVTAAKKPAAEPGPAPVDAIPNDLAPPPATTPPAADKAPDAPAPVAKEPAEKPADKPAAGPSVKDIPVDPSAGQTNENPTGRQEPAASIEWIGPATAKVGQSVTYQIVVKNLSAGRIHQVALHCIVPEGATVGATEPQAGREDGMLVWALGEMEPRQERRFDVQLVPAATGSLPCHAYLTLTGMSTATLKVHEPKLAIKSFAPKNVIAGDPATVMLTVSNPGDAIAEAVKVKAVLSDGLEHAHGKVIEFDLGNLAPNESRNVFVLCGAKSAGTQTCEAAATAQPRLSAQETASIDVLSPRLNLSVTGPGMRYLDRHAVFVYKVTNPGTAAANHVTLVNQIPAGFKVVSASAGGQHDFVARTVAWFLGDLAPEQTKEVSLELVAVNPGEHKNRAVVTAARGLRSEAEVATRIEGLPALLMELVDLDDPLEVGAETSYEIRVTNTGTKTETNLQLTCTVPDGMEFRGAKAATGGSFRQQGQEIIFDTLPRLAPRADALYRVKVRGKLPGDMRFQARMKADGLAFPVLKEESTKVYGDEAEPKADEPKPDEPKPVDLKPGEPKPLDTGKE